jgi:hypothetical protein
MSGTHYLDGRLAAPAVPVVVEREAAAQDSFGRVTGASAFGAAIA